jgi:MoaA/NifB/PqqE/SkfB family radical SAM enzyme/SAM-dependent methyltransferase
MKALIKVGYGCNDHCTFCHTYDVRHIDDTADRVAQKIRRAAALGHSMVVFSGGEPTIRPEIVSWAKFANQLGLAVGLVTNGRMLSYAPFLERMLARRLEYVYLSLHGGDERVHDASVRSHAFAETWRGLQNCSGRGLDVTANCVVTSINVDHLIGVVDLVARLPDVRLNLSMTEPKGGAEHLFDQVVPDVSYAAARVRDALLHAREIGIAHRVGHGGFPLCLLPGFEHAYGDLRTHGFATMTEVWEDDLFPIDDRNKVHPAVCDDCALRGGCPGLYRGYESRHGSQELRPVRGVRSNSFNYVEERTIAWRAGAPCPLLAGGTAPYDRGRSLLVRYGDVIRVHRTTTRDFSDLEIETTKRRLEQVYVDVSDKHAADDFAADLRKLAVQPECTTCAEYERCTRCYRILDDDMFTRDDAALLALLAELRGDVLDVGCGDARYGDVLAPLVAAGLVRYRGVEPNADAAERVRRRWPWASIDETPVEALNFDAASFDHVLVLRSYNHLREPRRVIAALVRALRPGGTLLVADNVAFGLVRDRRQAQRAETGPATFEHYRNDGTDQVVDALAFLPLDLLRRTEVAAGTSNQWYLHYRRRAGAVAEVQTADVERRSEARSAVKRSTIHLAVS